MDICFHSMAQIASSNEFKQSLSPSLGTARAKEVDKEEALQMEAEALSKMQKEKVVACNRQSTDALSSSWPNVQPRRKQDCDLMVFPESDVKKTVGDKLNTIDIEKITHAELEKLLLEGNFEASKPPTLPPAPVMSPSFSSQFYARSAVQWTTGLPGPSTCTVPSIYSAPSYSKQVGIFQNGFHPGMSTYQSTKPVYLGLPERSQYISYPLPAATTFHLQGSLPGYHPTLTPEMAKVFDKIASTSEFLKTGRTSTDLEATDAKSAISLPTSENANDISKFDWLDLDPLSKPKVDSVDILYTEEDSGKVTCSIVVEDPWDAVLQQEKSMGKCLLERKVSGKSTSGATVTRSRSLNIRTAQLAKVQGQSSQVKFIPKFILKLKFIIGYQSL